MTIDSVLKRASALVTPSRIEVERLQRVGSKINSLLQDEFGKREIQPEISLGGSYAKDTWLKGSADIDYFLLFPEDYPREKLEGEAIDSCKNAVKKYRIEMRFAEHPYVEAFVENVRVNLVPCYRVEKGNWKSAADRSPYHAEYIRSRFTEELKLEARLLKKFVKSARVYGAEVKIQGFSGYVCEVLTLKFGSFVKALEGISNTKPGDVISLEDYDKELAASFKSSFVILDPVDTTRNLGSAISPENAARLVIQARRFLAKPANSYFLERPQRKMPIERDLLSRTVIITFKNEKRSVDILWGQLKKSCKSLASKLEDNGFTVLRERTFSDEKGESAFAFLLLELRVSALQLREGPEYFRANEVERYLEKNAKRSRLTWIDEEGRILSVADRDPAKTSAQTFLKTYLSDKKKVDKLGLSKAVREEISRGFKIFTGKKTGKTWLDEELQSLLTTEE